MSRWRRTIACSALSLMAVCFAEVRGNEATPRTFRAPDSIPKEIIERLNAGKDDFMPALRIVLHADESLGLLLLVDKQHPLPADYVPKDLVALGSNRHYVVSREGFSLRAPAEAALERMARAAQADGVTLVVSSAYRSFDYQKKVYTRIVAELGQTAADRESARPGTSQHQTGCAVDFGSITDEFALTRAGRWLAVHASEYGWSLSFPDGYEAVTGYRWECWHYRYIGEDAARVERAWFGGIQQYLIEFADEWRKAGL